jgi:CheY-like chemotaxis protein
VIGSRHNSDFELQVFRQLILQQAVEGNEQGRRSLAPSLTGCLSPPFRAPFTKLLATECNVVGRTSDGRQAFKAAKDLKPDVMVLDISMPVMNGIETLKGRASTTTWLLPQPWCAGGWPRATKLWSEPCR